MATTYRSKDWDTYKMTYSSPHKVLETPDSEIGVVDAALAALCDAGILPHTRYDHDKLLAHRHAVAALFDFEDFCIRCATELPTVLRFIGWAQERCVENMKRLSAACAGISPCRRWRDVQEMALGCWLLTPRSWLLAPRSS